ncbi:MAG: hypothetical protein WBB25_01870 [Sulfitobacter sp.]
MIRLPTYFTVKVGFAPLPPPWFTALREIEIETAVGQASIFRLHFDLSRNAWGDFDALAIDLFRPLVPISICISAGPGLPLTVINGFVADATLQASNSPGASTYEVVGMDALGTIMAHVEVPFTWPNMSDDLIATSIFGRYGMIPVTTPVPPFRTILDTTTTQRGSDAAFLQVLAGRNGVSLYVQPEPISGRDMGHFHPPLVPPLPPQGVLSIDFGAQTNLDGFSVSNNMLGPTGVFGVMTDPRTRAPVPIVAPVAAEMPLGLEPALTRIIPPPVETTLDDTSASPAEAVWHATQRATQSARALRASAEVDGLKFARPIFAGIPILVRGAGRQHSGLYMVDRVSHRISRDEYKQSVGLWRNAVGLTGAEVFVDPLAAA